jgi:flagellar biosynthesis GTPase FlhF
MINSNMGDLIMKTIELVCGGKPVQFTTRSVTIDGKEYFYSLMSGVTHNEVERYYTFRYDGELITLPYDDKSIKVFQVIFKQVQTLEAKKIATQQLSAAAIAAAEAKEAEKKRLAEEAKANAEAKEVVEEVPVEEPVAEETASEEPASEEVTEETSEETPAEAVPETTEEPDKKAKKEKKEKKEKAPVDPVLKARKKKAITKFVIILVVFALIAVGYFTIFGTNSAPSTNAPVAPESQQYDDIDQIIDELQ